MATLTRTRASSTDFQASHALSLDVPKPFPSRAEQEQAELLESLALEDLHLEDEAEPTPGPSTIPAPLDDTRKPEGDLLPSIINLRASCLTTLSDLLSSSPIQNGQSIITPSSSDQSQLSEGADDTTLLHELRLRVDHVAPTLGSRDADLAHALLGLLTHFHMLSSLYSSAAKPGTPRPTSYLHSVTPPDSMPSSSTNPLRHLRRHLNDFQTERLSRSDTDLLGESRSPMLTVQSALLWTQIDEQLETVLSLCRSSFDDASTIHLPPQYDPADYDPKYEDEGLPEYELGDYQLDRRAKSFDKGSASDAAASPTMSFASTSEKMKMDLEAVTQAIDRLYEVAPQLHNQRVELKKTKVEQMEKARREGKGKQLDGPPDEREFEKMLELIGKAADRKMADQSVVIGEDMRTRTERFKERERVKRASFVEELLRHSGAGRLDSQDATFPVSQASRSAAATRMRDPDALLTLPEFIREAVPQAVSERMHMNERISLPDFMKEPIPQLSHSSRHSRFQSVSMTNQDPPESAPPEASSMPRPSSKSGKPKNLRSRSLSAPPLAWLLSNGSVRSTSPAKIPKTTRPGSSHGRLPSLEALNITYVAEYHENLQHILVFLTIAGAVPSAPVEAEVVARTSVDELPHLIIRSGMSSSLPLELPARVILGKKEIRLVGENHYEVKLYTPSPTRSQSRPGSPLPPSADLESASIMDATYFTTAQPTSFICTSCSLPLVHTSRVSSYRDLPSEHWAELVDAWMCHGDMKLHEDVKKGSKDGFWPRDGEVLVGGSYVLLQEDVVVGGNIRGSRQEDKADEWSRVRCMCGAVVGRCQEHSSDGKPPVQVYRLIKYAFRPMTSEASSARVPLSAFIVEDMNEFVQAHATYRFVLVDEEEDRPRILIWLFKPNMRLSYATTSPYSIPKNGSVRAAKILFKLLGPSTPPSDLSSILNKYPGFPQAEHLYYPIDICHRIAALLKESNRAYPESMRTMTGLDVGWLHRA